MSGIVGVLNQSTVKQGIKNIVGLGTCVIGAKAFYDAGRGKIYTKYAYHHPIVDKIALACAQVSFVLSATVTPLGIWGISFVVNRVFSSAQLEKVFGPNTTFASNWKHPRHVVSLVAVGLAIPLIMRRLFILPDNKEQRALEMCAYWMVFTSRPVLHLGNQLAQKLFK